MLIKMKRLIRDDGVGEVAEVGNRCNRKINVFSQGLQLAFCSQFAIPNSNWVENNCRISEAELEVMSMKSKKLERHREINK